MSQAAGKGKSRMTDLTKGIKDLALMCGVIVVFYGTVVVASVLFWWAVQ